MSTHVSLSSTSSISSASSHRIDTPPLLSSSSLPFSTSLPSSHGHPFISSPFYPNTHQNLWTRYNSSPPLLSSHQENVSPTTMTTASTVGMGRHYSMFNQCTTTYMYTNSSPMAPVPTYSTSFMSHRGDGTYETPVSMAKRNSNSPHKYMQQDGSKLQVGYARPSCYIMLDNLGYSQPLRNEQGACDLPTPDLTPEFDATPADNSSSVFF